MSTEERKQVEEQLRWDRVLYGSSFCMTRADGSVERIDPSTIKFAVKEKHMSTEAILADIRETADVVLPNGCLELPLSVLQARVASALLAERNRTIEACAEIARGMFFDADWDGPVRGAVLMVEDAIRALKSANKEEQST